MKLLLKNCHYDLEMGDQKVVILALGDCSIIRPNGINKNVFLVDNIHKQKLEHTTLQGENNLFYFQA